MVSGAVAVGGGGVLVADGAAIAVLVLATVAIGVAVVARVGVAGAAVLVALATGLASSVAVASPAGVGVVLGSGVTLPFAGVPLGLTNIVGVALDWADVVACAVGSALVAVGWLAGWVGGGGAGLPLPVG